MQQGGPFQIPTALKGMRTHVLCGSDWLGSGGGLKNRPHRGSEPLGGMCLCTK